MNMTDLIISGAGGKMGRTVANLASQRENCRVVAGFEGQDTGPLPFPLFRTPAECNVSADAVIDFSHPSVLSPLLNWALETKIPLVLCTTGYTPEQTAMIQEASARLPIFFSANMSLGVNLMAALCEKAACILGGTFDIEIIEKHHNQKIDAPSGTALMLADRISGALPYDPQYVYDRHARRQKRQKQEIGIHAVRGGTIVGEHEVIFAGNDEILTISHSAASKQVFAAGALSAAVFLKSQKPGLYNMADLV